MKQEMPAAAGLGTRMRLTEHKEVLTTGDVARICHVAPRTVSKWFDSGQLRGYRIPGSRDRRIPRQHLLAFMRAHGMPLDEVDGAPCRVLILDATVPPSLVASLNETEHYEVRTARDGFEAGVLAQQFRPHAVVLDVDDQAEQARTVRANLRTLAGLAAAIVAATGRLSAERRAALLADGYDACIARPYEAADLCAVVEEATNLVR